MNKKNENTTNNKSQATNKTPNYKDNLYLTKRLFKIYVFPYKFKFLISILLMFIIAGTTGAHAYLVKPALDKVFVEKDTSVLVIIPIIIMIITIIKAIYYCRSKTRAL
jgi:subfamily B ATP-binding cassette protein MsbA